MAKTELTLSNGTKVTIEGDPAEVREIAEAVAVANQGRFGRTLKPKSSRGSLTTGRDGPTDRILALKQGGFFKERRSLAAIREGLEESGFIYPMTTLSPVVIRLVRAGQLRRVKEKGGWLYVNP